MTRLYRDAVLSSKRAMEAMGPMAFANPREELMYAPQPQGAPLTNLQPSRSVTSHRGESFMHDLDIELTTTASRSQRG